MAMVRLRYPPHWIVLPHDADFDVSLAVPAFKDVVRLLAHGEAVPLGAMAFSTTSTIPI